MNPEVVLSFSWTLSSVFLMWLCPRDKDALWQKSDALEFQQKLKAGERWPVGHGGEPLASTASGSSADGAEAHCRSAGRLREGPRARAEGPDGELGQALAWRPLGLGRACCLLVLREPVEEGVLGRVPGHSRIPEREES